jgi:hypothetical protein
MTAVPAGSPFIWETSPNPNPDKPELKIED